MRPTLDHVAATRVYAAQLAGLQVFGPTGELIGKVRDLVAALRLDRQPPRVLGVVVELPTHRPIFVPIGRVAAIESHAVVLVTGTVNLTRFERRPTELLLLRQVVGAQVRIATTAAAASVTDAGVEQTRTRDWLVTKLAVRERTSLLTRRAPVQVLGWSDVRGVDAADLLATVGLDTQALLTSFEGAKAADVASALRDLPAGRRREIAEAMGDEQLADIIEELPEDDQKDLLTHLDEARAADVLEAMNPDDAADLLSDLPPGVKDRLLELMEPEESEPVRRLLQYSPDTAGGLMTTDAVVLAPDATIAEALARVRAPELTPALASMVFVCRPPQATPTGRYLGCVHTQRLLRDPPFELVAGALDTEMARLSVHAPLLEVTRFFATYNLVCAPVVDEEEHLLGVVSVDDVLDHLLPENWRDMSLAEMSAPGPADGSESAGRSASWRTTGPARVGRRSKGQPPGGGEAGPGGTDG